ncbi:MAG: hypothetical protein R3264_10420, partial [Anaerolineae bacterium]|nr:hypothetical protein [Anaerolineae bacterium]
MLTFGLGPVFAAVPPAQQGQTIAGTDIILLADENYFPAHVPAASAGAELSGLSTPVIVNFNPSGCSGPVASWPAEAQAAFNHAASLWSGFLNGNHPIEIDACWRTDLGSGSLGRARPVTLHLNFSGAPVANTHYPAALANQLAGSDLNHADGTDWDGNGLDADSEIRVDLNGNRANWYFGLTGNTPGTDYNFVAAALHEIGHGLGLIGSMSIDDGQGFAECTGITGVGCWGFGSGSPYAYDRYTENGSGQTLLNTNQFPNPSTALAA